MSWQIESRRHYVEVARQVGDRRIVTSNTYTPGPYSSEFVLVFGNDERLIVVAPYEEEVLYQDVRLPRRADTMVTRLLVGIRDEERLSFVAKLWESNNEEGLVGFERFSFDKDRPSSCSTGIISSAGWPRNHGVLISPAELTYLEALKAERPRVAGSL